MTHSHNSNITLYDMVVVGLMAAMIFVATMFLGIRIPTPTGTTMLKTANALCIIGGVLFGPWRGGLAAGLGSALFDLTYPEYVAGAPLTFLFYFAMAFVAGGIAHWGGAHGQKRGRLVAGAVVGAYFYSALYIGKSLLSLVLLGSTFQAALLASSVKIVSSLTNATFAWVIAVAFAPVLRSALTHAGLTPGSRTR